MKIRHMVALLQEGYTTVQVRFSNGGRLYTYKARKTDGIVPRDYVIVDTPSDGFKIAQVELVDETPQIEVDAEFTYKWIVQKVDPTWYLQTLERERKFADVMREIERVRAREQLMADMQTKLPEGSQARVMFDTAVASLSGPVIEQPAQEQP